MPAGSFGSVTGGTAGSRCPSRRSRYRRRNADLHLSTPLGDEPFDDLGIGRGRDAASTQVKIAVDHEIVPDLRIISNEIGDQIANDNRLAGFTFTIRHSLVGPDVEDFDGRLPDRQPGVGQPVAQRRNALGLVVYLKSQALADMLPFTQVDEAGVSPVTRMILPSGC